MRKKKPEIPSQPICPVCGNTFVKTEEHCYLVKGAYTCSWACFTKYTKEVEMSKKKKREEQQDKPKRGRPRKTWVGYKPRKEATKKERIEKANKKYTNKGDE